MKGPENQKDQEKKYVKKIKNRIKISIGLMVVTLVFVSGSLITPWFSTHIDSEINYTLFHSFRSDDYDVDFYITETVMEESNNKGVTQHAPHDKSDGDYFEHLKNIFYLIIFLILLIIICIFILMRLHHSFKGFKIALLFLSFLIILSIITMITFFNYTIEDNDIDEFFDIDNLWENFSEKDKYGNTINFQCHPNLGFYLISICVILLILNLVCVIHAWRLTIKNVNISEYKPIPLKINRFQVLGILAFLLAFLFLFSSYWNPWWVCNTPVQNNDYDYSATEFGWGPDYVYFMVIQENDTEHSIFNGSIYSKESVDEKEFFAGDFKEGEYKTYEKEKEVVSNTANLIFIGFIITILTLISGVYILSINKNIKWIVIIGFISALIIMVTLIYFSISLPIAYQEDMRKPYIENDYQIPEHSQATIVTSFSGEFKGEFDHAPWIEELSTQPEVDKERFDYKLYYKNRLFGSAAKPVPRRKISS